MNVIEAREKYNDYLEKHISEVWNSCIDNITIFVESLSEMNIDSVDIHSTIREVCKEILKHDASKYDTEEYEPYRANFFPISEGEKKVNAEKFKRASNRHCLINLHHWNAWVNHNGEAKEMYIVYIIEMVCDWIAMGRSFNNTAKEFYESKKDDIILHPETRVKLELILSKDPK